MRGARADRVARVRTGWRWRRWRRLRTRRRLGRTELPAIGTGRRTLCGDDPTAAAQLARAIAGIDSRQERAHRTGRALVASSTRLCFAFALAGMRCACSRGSAKAVVEIRDAVASADRIFVRRADRRKRKARAGRRIARRLLAERAARAIVATATLFVRWWLTRGERREDDGVFFARREDEDRQDDGALHRRPTAVKAKPSASVGRTDHGAKTSSFCGPRCAT